MRHPTGVNAALYLRLSRDDDEYGDSVSIDTQRTILRQYVQEQGFHVVDEYVDDGWSGMSFERPEFLRMLDDIDTGKVNCVITKDLSRFGREHIMMDYYLELVFPEKQIRYIAVTDNEDTDKGLSDFVPFKNMFNEFWVKDTSRKVKAAFKAKFAAGQRIFAYAPLGYKRNPDRKNHLIIDEETRWIVEKIYDLAYHGAGAAKITRVLIQEQVPTPGWLNYRRDGTFANIYADAPESKRYAWTIAQVKSILHDETYIGNTVHYRETSISYKSKKRVRKPESAWLRVEGTHEGIVAKEVFERVQEQTAARRRRMKDATTQIFAGLLRCADCGWSMSFATNRSNKTPYSYFNCASYRQFGRAGGACTAHYIRYDVLYVVVLDRIRYWAAQAEADQEALLARLLAAVGAQANRSKKEAQAELKRAEKRLKELDALFVRLYEDRGKEELSERNYRALSARYQEEQDVLAARIEELHVSAEQEREKREDAKKWVDLIRRLGTPTELTAPLLNALIEKILIHEAVKRKDGTREQEIEIFYRFVGKIE